MVGGYRVSEGLEKRFFSFSPPLSFISRRVSVLFRRHCKKGEAVAYPDIDQKACAPSGGGAGGGGAGGGGGGAGGGDGGAGGGGGDGWR